ncbi:MAG: winged helix-turn-helix domain-containing protein [Candidatus Levybacteria bacterium]|nr:winged helix-turn-helix domain-containing protein [Candidatus Levybacteria bacterium]
MKQLPTHVQFESLYPADTWFNEVGQIIKFVKEGKSSQLIGAPGVGKYAIFGLLSYNHDVRVRHLGEEQTSYHFVQIDFSEIRNRPLMDVMKMLFLALTDSLRDRKMMDCYNVLNEFFRNALSMQDELVMTEELKHALETLVYEHNLTTVYLFERFEEYVPTLTSEFFTNLRLIRNRVKYHFSVVFSVNKPLEDLLEPQVYADFYDQFTGNVIYMPLFDKASTAFRIEQIEEVSGKKVPESVVNELVKLTGGHGKLMRMCVEAYLAAEEKPKDLEKFLFEQQTVRAALAEIWFSLSPVEQAAMRETHNAEKEEASSLEYLEHIGLLKNKSITIPLLAWYMSSSQRVRESSAGKIAYDEAANKITKGSLTLSDDLTSSEFLMLRYLVLHPEEIVSREQLINVVWGDNRSTAGVTDQALDQLIFRLRKKIEENPNEPRHTQTVKGRGVKFTP